MSKPFRIEMSLPGDQAHALTAALEQLFDGTATAIGLWRGDAGRWSVEVHPALDITPAACVRMIAETAANAGITHPPLVVDWLKKQDWIARGLAQLGPIRAGRFFVHGSHDRARRPGSAIALEIDAGQAFGTGHHETTRACLLALDELLKFQHVRRVIDIGTGSGILALAMAGVLAPETVIIATDIDPVALETARSNALSNEMRSRISFLCADGLHHPAVRLAGPYDLACANILAGPLKMLAPDITECLAPNAALVLSGLLGPQAPPMLAHYLGHSMVLHRRIDLGDWTTLVLRRPGPD